MVVTISDVSQWRSLSVMRCVTLVVTVSAVLCHNGSHCQCCVVSQWRSLSVLCCVLCHRLDPSGNSSRQSLDFDKENKGAVVDMAYFDTGKGHGPLPFSDGR